MEYCSVVRAEVLLAPGGGDMEDDMVVDFLLPLLPWLGDMDEEAKEMADSPV